MVERLAREGATLMAVRTVLAKGEINEIGAAVGRFTAVGLEAPAELESA